MAFFDSEHPQTSNVNEQMTAGNYVLNIFLAHEHEIVYRAKLLQFSFQVPLICFFRFDFVLWIKYRDLIKNKSTSG